MDTYIEIVNNVAKTLKGKIEKFEIDDFKTTFDQRWIEITHNETTIQISFIDYNLRWLSFSISFQNSSSVHLNYYNITSICFDENKVIFESIQDQRVDIIEIDSEGHFTTQSGLELKEYNANWIKSRISLTSN